MNPNSSLGKICLGEDVVVISSDKVEGSRDWNSLEFQDTTNSGQNKETKAMGFYQMETEEVSDRFVAPCFVNGLEAYDVKRGNKVVKNELIVALRGEIYFVKFIINPEEDDVEPEKPKKKKSNDDWDHLLDFNIDDIPLLGKEGLSPFVCKMGKSGRNKKRAMENLNFFYQDIGTSSSAGGHLTQEEAAKEELAIKMIWKVKVELDGKIVKEDEEAVKKIKRGRTVSDINTMPFRIYVQLGREDMKKVDRGITVINHTQAEAMGILINVLCQVGVTTLIAKFLILDISIDHDSPIVVGQGFLRTIGGIVNALWEHTMMRPDHHDPNALDNVKPYKKYCFHKFTMSSCYGKDITELQSLELCHEFYSTYEFDKVYANDELQTKKIIKFRLGGIAHSLALLEFA
ncbi:hypothetical protein Tco_1397321 [Tanacetum coccineum]